MRKEEANAIHSNICTCTYMYICINNNYCFHFTVPPLFVIEFLHRVMDIFTDYFGDCSEQRIKDNYVIVYEVRTRVDLGSPKGYEITTLYMYCIFTHPYTTK